MKNVAKKKWETPEVKTLQAGAAEGGVLAGNDGGGGLTGS